MEPTIKHIRISITSERYEVAASLFDSVYGDLAEQAGGNVPPHPHASCRGAAHGPLLG